MARTQRDDQLGLNPWGVSFVNSVGSEWPHHPPRQVSDLTGSELVGFWDEGPVRRSAFLGSAQSGTGLERARQQPYASSAYSRACSSIKARPWAIAAASPASPRCSRTSAR